MNYKFLQLIAVLIFLSIAFTNAKGEETEAVLKQIEILQNDIKTLEKAVYSDNINTSRVNTKLSVSSPKKHAV